jgi:phosphate transport system substrate-binding protein
MKSKLTSVFLIIGFLITSIFLLPCSADVLTQVGSNTLINATQAWVEAYTKINPDVTLKIEGGGSKKGIDSLINGVVDIANSSRAMNAREIENAKNRGQSPIEYIVGYDALAVFVHPSNPINHLSITQITEMYGEDGTISKWSDLGIEMPVCDSQEVILVSRQSSSGTVDYFRSSVIGKDFKLSNEQTIVKMSDSKAVVDLIEKSPCAIGYGGLGYVTSNVKMLCISKKEKEECAYPSIKSVEDGSYPIARPLFVYTDGPPEGELKKYIEWILSDQGQCILLKEGYAPIRSSLKCDLDVPK